MTIHRNLKVELKRNRSCQVSPYIHHISLQKSSKKRTRNRIISQVELKKNQIKQHVLTWRNNNAFKGQDQSVQCIDINQRIKDVTSHLEYYYLIMLTLVIVRTGHYAICHPTLVPTNWLLKQDSMQSALSPRSFLLIIETGEYAICPLPSFSQIDF